MSPRRSIALAVSVSILLWALIAALGFSFPAVIGAS